MKRSAFTLIELLVVIAIIAILAAILFPVFAQAKMAAKKASDLAQIKQIGTGIHIYLNDYDDTFPLAQVGIYATYANDWNGQVRWSGNEVLQPYIKNGAIFKSPGDSSTLSALPSWIMSYPQMSGNNKNKVYVNSYFANALSLPTGGGDNWAFDPGEASPPGQAGLFGVGPATVNSAENYYSDAYPKVGTATNATQVQFPSELIMLADGATDQDHYWDAYSNSGCGNTTNTQMNFCSDDLDESWRVLALLVNYYGWTPPMTTVMREYSGSANYAMADSSAKSFKPGQLVKNNLYLNQHRWLVIPGQ